MSFKGLGVTESKLATIESENAGVQHTNPGITSSEPSSQYTRLVRAMVFNATFNNMFNATFNKISVISWRSVLLEEETGVPGENHRPAVGH
jgi:hypothetical protein